MKIDAIEVGEGNLPRVSATVDGVRCDVSRESGVLVVRPVAWDRAHEILASGDAVPVELAAAFKLSVEKALEFSLGVKPRLPITVVHPDLLAVDPE